MNTSTKKTIYGLIFFFIAVALIVFVYQSFLKPTSSCSDGKQNQDEDDIDCGGSCTPCEILNLQDLRITRDVKFFTTSDGKITAFTEILNPNRDFNAREFSYTFLVYNQDGRVIEEVNGKSSVDALGRKLILEVGLKTFWKSIAKLEFYIENPKWERSFEALKPLLDISEGPETIVSGGAIRVLGKIKNQSSYSVSNVKIIAMLFDTYGKEIFISQTIISSVGKYAEREFSIAFPTDQNLVDILDLTRTKIIIETE